MKRMLLLSLFLLVNGACDSVSNPNVESEEGTELNAKTLHPPALVSPQNGAQNVASSTLLEWESVQGTSEYRLQLATEKTFSSSLLDSTIADTLLAVKDLAKESTFYWRVNAQRDAPGALWSEVRSFKTDADVKVPSAPALIAPEKGSGDHPNTVTLSWEEVSEAKTYQVQVSGNTDFSSTKVDKEETNTSTEITDLSSGKTYYWRVRSVNESAVGEWSENFEFSIKAEPVDNTAPTISISSSKQVVTEGESVTINSSAEDDSGITSIELYIDGNPVESCSNTKSCSHTTSSSATGSHSFYAIAIDASSNSNQSQSETKSYEVKASPTTEETFKIMPLGDSITEAFGYRIPLWNKLEDQGFTIDYVGSQSDPHPDLPDEDHEGHGGWTIGNIAESVNGWLSANQPDVVLLMIGTNDVAWWSALNGAEIADKHASLVDQILANTSSDTWVMVASIPPQSSKIIEPNKIDRVELAKNYNAEVKQRMQQRIEDGKQIVFVDMHPKLSVGMLRDGIHPNSEGYEIIAQTWFDALLSSEALK